MTEGSFLQYVSNHIIVTNQLLKTLKAYIEAKNHGIHGLFIKTINDVLNKIQWELDDLYKTQQYLVGKVDSYPISIAIVKTIKPMPIMLNFKVVSEDTLLKLKAQLIDAYKAYSNFRQSKNIQTVKHILDKLEND